MKRIKIITVILLVFVSFNLILKGIDKYRISHGLSETSTYDTLSPGEFIGTVALGGFRAVAIDFLWIRAIDAWEEKQWYEALALYRLISRLQPRLQNIWIINAWNMIYNISIDLKQKELEEASWKWIKEGIDFLKEGISRNPNSPELHFYLGWVYFDKGKIDYYREQFLNRGEHPVKNACYYIEKASELSNHDYYFYDYWHSFMLKERAEIEEIEGNIAQAVMSIKDSIKSLQLTEKNVPKHTDFYQFEAGIKTRLKELEDKRRRLEEKLNDKLLKG